MTFSRLRGASIGGTRPTGPAEIAEQHQHLRIPSVRMPYPAARDGRADNNGLRR